MIAGGTVSMTSVGVIVAWFAAFVPARRARRAQHRRERARPRWPATVVGMDDRTRTGSAETAAEPGSVVRLLADAGRLPAWAPAFADAVTSEGGSRWRAVKDGRDFGLRTAVNLDAGTVDYLREIAPAAKAAPTCGSSRGPVAEASSS